MKIIILFFSILAAVSANAQAVADTLCSTPPMGWNSWNCFHRDIQDKGNRRPDGIHRAQGCRLHIP